MFYVHTRSRITHYEYWFNGMDSLKRVVNVTPPQDTLSIITMLPVDTTLPLRSNSFLFDPNNGHPVIYARNRISLRFLTGDCRYVETHADYADVNIKDTVMADTLERSTTKQIVAPMNNAIHWFKLAVEAGDSMLFRADKPCTMQLFATSGKELFLETGDSVLHWINCIGEENGVYYLAVHDAEDTGQLSVSYRNGYQITVVSSDTTMGKVTGDGHYKNLTQVMISATPKYGYHFTQWNDGDTTNPRTVTLLGDTSFMASFAPNDYQLTVASSDTLKGGVTGGGSFAYLSQVKISATSNYGYHFTQWNDGDTTNPRVVTLKGDTSFTASFAVNNYNLAVVSSDTLKGGVTGGGSFAYLSQALISATPKYGYHFTQWNDGDTTNPRLITMKGDTSFTATFSANSYKLAAISADTVNGMVSGGGSYTYLSQVKISATPKYGYHFTQWNDGDTTNPRVVTLKGDTTFIATFAPNDYLLTVTAGDTVRWIMTVSGSFAYMSKIKLTAASPYGYHFVQWNDGDTTNPRVITLTQDTMFFAMFAPNDYLLTVASSDEEMGVVEGGDTYSYLDTAILRAAAAEHHHFLHWSDGNRENPRMVTVLGDSSFTAVFAIDTHRLTVLSNDTAMGHVTEGGYYAYGTEVELTAVAADNHHFVRWDDGDTTNPRIVTVTEDMELTAYFEKNTGVKEPELPEGISIYGSDHHIIIKGAEGYEVKILNAIGQLIHRAVINEDVLRVRMPVKGVYFVKVGAFPPKKVLVY